jgi:hypothetical protein
LNARSSVDLPEPLSPTSATHSAAATSSDTASSATIRPYRFRTSLADRTGIACGMAPDDVGW